MNLVVVSVIERLERTRLWILQRMGEGEYLKEKPKYGLVEKGLEDALGSGRGRLNLEKGSME